MCQSSMKEHLSLSATKCDNQTNFVREVESIEYAKKTISAPTPIRINSFQGNCHKCGNTDTPPKSVGVRAKEGQRSLNVRIVKETSWTKSWQTGAANCELAGR